MIVEADLTLEVQARIEPLDIVKGLDSPNDILEFICQVVELAGVDYDGEALRRHLAARLASWPDDREP